MWKNFAIKTPAISLHDCRADRLFIEGKDLYFEFNDGFWLIDNTEYNDTDKTCKTDKSQLKLSNYEIEDIFIFEEVRLFGRILFTKRKSLTVEELQKKLELGDQLEFITTYDAYRKTMYSCWLWSEKKPYHKECQLFIRSDSSECFWNEMRLDRQW